MGVVTSVNGSESRRRAISIRDNPLVAEDATLARTVERDARHLLKSEDVGPVEVRFHVCRDHDHGLRFICKVEGPPAKGINDAVQWRWWSPLMETAEDFRNALVEGLRVRRDRLEMWSHPIPLAR